jgi:uncharacterized membrane protein HdeD (DUF308 family)
LDVVIIEDMTPFMSKRRNNRRRAVNPPSGDTTLEVEIMVEMLARNWGWVLMRGIAAILFGILAFANPGIALMTLVLLFGAYAFLDGVFMLVSAVANRKGQSGWAALLVGGILGIAVGIGTVLLPKLTAVALLAVIASWAIIIGIAEIVAAITLRKVLTGEWMLMLAGLGSAIFGVFIFARPSLGALAVVLWIGTWATVSGILLVALAFRLRSWGRSPASASPPRARQRGAAAEI